MRRIFPSAAVWHENIAILAGENRWAFTLFSAAALFRWVTNGNMTDKDWVKKARMSQFIVDQKP